MSQRFSLTLATWFGIPIRVHASFFILLLYVGLSSEPNSVLAVVIDLLFLTSVFCCVLLHELGHALTARVFGIKTRDIVLYPVGGVASIVGEPKPKQELVIAAAGPLVNVIIALILYPLIELPETPQATDLSFMTQLFIANVMLCVFNLYPAYPMDGGRILRALLAVFGVRRATQVAARISQVLSVILGIFAIYASNPFLLLIAFLIFSHAAQERLKTDAHAHAEGHSVRELTAPLSQLVTFTHGTSIAAATAAAMPLFQTVFPVVLGDTVLGFVTRNQLLAGAPIDEEAHYVASIMDRDIVEIEASASLIQALKLLEQAPRISAFVVRDSTSSAAPLASDSRGGQVLGILARDRLIEFLLLSSEGSRASNSFPNNLRKKHQQL